MGDHRKRPSKNPIALANAVPQQQVRVMDLGDSIGLAGISFEPMRTKEGAFAIAIIATGGRMSDLVPMQPVRVMIGMLPTIPLEAIKALLDGREPPALPEVQQPEADA